MALNIVSESPFSAEVTEQFRSPIAPAAGSPQQTEAILVAAYSLGVKRADLLQRGVEPSDVEYALSILCHWPFKPQGIGEIVAQTRAVSQHAAQEAIRGDARELDRLVPDFMLLLSTERLHELQDRGALQYDGRSFAISEELDKSDEWVDEGNGWPEPEEAVEQEGEPAAEEEGEGV